MKRHKTNYDDQPVKEVMANFLKNAKDRNCGRELRRRENQNPVEDIDQDDEMGEENGEMREPIDDLEMEF